jgi:ribosomal protein RSM22 (predicted rRNA methylase)
VPVVGGRDGDYEMVTLQGEEEDLQTPRQWADDDLSHNEMQAALRGQAYQWPRLVYPPMKRSGHVVMDTCHPSGESSEEKFHALVPDTPSSQGLSFD